MAYRVKMIYPSGTEEYEDEIFETKAEAVAHGEYMVDCFSAGGEVLDAMGVGGIPGMAEFEVEKI